MSVFKFFLLLNIHKELKNHIMHILKQLFYRQNERINQINKLNFMTEIINYTLKLYSILLFVISS